MSIWSSIVGAIPAAIGQVGEYFKRRQEIRLKRLDGEARLEEAKVEGMIALMRDRQSADIDWEKLSIQNSGWKDEYLTVLFTGLLLGCFFPLTQPYVVEGFNTLDGLPIWYQTVLIVIVGSAFGVRVWDNFLGVAKQRRKKKEKKDA